MGRELGCCGCAKITTDKTGLILSPSLFKRKQTENLANLPKPDLTNPAKLVFVAKYKLCAKCKGTPLCLVPRRGHTDHSLLTVSTKLLHSTYNKTQANVGRIGVRRSRAESERHVVGEDQVKPTTGESSSGSGKLAPATKEEKEGERRRETKQENNSAHTGT